MLHEFLLSHKKEILELCEKKSKSLAGTHTTSEQLKLGLPLFYDQLITVLSAKMNAAPPQDMLEEAASHGKEFLRLGYSLSHVVHSYGAMCQAITELATMKNKNISAEEFNLFNGCLDVAIASAVSEYEYRSNLQSEAREVKHLGFLTHELRNALSTATIASGMIRAGLVGTNGSTATVLEESLSRMAHLIDRSLSEVRMRADVDLFVEKFNIFIFLDRISITAKVEALKKHQTVTINVDPDLEVETDRQFLLSAVANLLQNAIKYTPSHGKILVVATESEGRILISIQDECGGIEASKLKTIFMAYTQENEDKSGMGLGLSIAKRAIEHCQGTIQVKNNAGIGCLFTIDIPKVLVPIIKQKVSVPGKDSVQPHFSKK